MKTLSELDAAQGRYVMQHAAFTIERGHEAQWLRDLRSRALERFAALGFPTTRHEEWKYTDVRPIARFETQNEAPSLNGLATAGPQKWALDGAHRLVWFNGRFAPELSQIGALPEGVTVCSIAEALANHSEIVQQNLARFAGFENEAFVALNTAFFEDGALVHVPNNVVIEAPIHLLFLSAGGTQSQPRNLFLVGDNSKVTIIEEYAGKSASETAYFCNAVTEVSVGKNAEVDHHKLVLEADAAYHVATMQVQQDRDCRFSSHAITFGGRLVRNQGNAVMGGTNIETTLNGLYVGGADQVIDNHTIMDHAQPHCASHEHYAGILAGKSRGVFNGKIFVRLDAQKTDAKQSNRTLLLSREAEIDAKPQLEIFADDVKCTHGATIGQLDDDALFYLRARGINKEAAQDILTHAFASDILERIKVAPLRERLERELFAKLQSVR